MRTKLRGKVTLLFLAFGLMVASAGTAWAADNLQSDGDGLAPITDSDIDAGNVPCNSPTDKTVLLALRHQGGGQIFKNSSTVTVNVQSVSGSGLSASMGSPNTITLPSNWETSGNGTFSSSVSATVTINPTVTGADSGTVTYEATGTQSNNTPLTRTDTMNVEWTAGSCDTTAPFVQSISTANANPTNTTGNVSWTVTFSEDVSGVDTSDFALTNSGLGGSPAILSVTQPDETDDSVYTVTASSGSGSGNLGLNLNDNDSIKDAANNLLFGTGMGTVGSGGDGNGSFDGDDYVIDRAAPTVTPTALKGVDPDYTDGAYSEGAWTNKDVQVTFVCADTGDSGLTSTSDDDVQTFTANTSASGTTATFSKTCKDNAGNTATSDLSFGPIKIDKTAPVVTDDSANNPPTGTAGSNDWFISAVTNTFKAADGLSGFLSPLTDPYTFGVGSGAAEGNNVSINSGTKFDVAGNESNNASSGPFKIDLTDPTVSVNLTPAAAATGWYNIATGKPTADFTCNDADGDGNPANGGASGIATPNGCTPDKTFDEGENQSATGNATDNAGRSDQTPASVSDVDVDLTEPSLGNIVDNNAASSNVCTTSSAPTQPTGFNPSDGLSGLDESDASKTDDTWTEPGSLTHPYGTYTYEAHATDVAGNTNSYGPKNYNYTLGIGSGGLSYNGVLQPINMPPATGPFTPSIFKLGSTVPVKFTLACGQTPYANAVAQLFVKKSDSTVAGDVNEAISTSNATTGNLFRYDATAGQYIFNLSTKQGYTYTDNTGTHNVAFSAGTWQITIKFADGTTKTATFDIKK